MSWNYHVPYQEGFASRSDNKADQFIDSLDATSARHLAERAIASDAEKAAADKFMQDEKVFRHMYPAFMDTEKNVRLMRHHWENVLGVKIPTLVELEETFFALRDSGVLQLNQKAVAKEDQEATIRRAAEIREARKEAEFNEDAAYSMPMMELESRARGW